ncbi:hypothetical protein QBC45DRAFT_437970 [Copromyces sp. CBS 386.78]|nr:hypothetical protein QBC45DRAFT_437970 [Copromyces sp. CBS 386.78]
MAASTKTIIEKFPYVNVYGYTSIQSRFSYLEAIVITFEKKLDSKYITNILGEAFTLERDIIGEYNLRLNCQPYLPHYINFPYLCYRKSTNDFHPETFIPNIHPSTDINDTDPEFYELEEDINTDEHAEIEAIIEVGEDLNTNQEAKDRYNYKKNPSSYNKKVRAWRNRKVIGSTTFWVCDNSSCNKRYLNKNALEFHWRQQKIMKNKGESHKALLRRVLN